MQQCTGSSRSSPVRRAQALRLLNVTGKALLAAIEIDGGDPLARLHQGNGDVQGYGGFARPALFVTQHNDMS